MPPLPEPISTPRTRPARTRTQGAGANHKKLPLTEVEPPGHGIGRSRGGLTTKIHHAVDGRGRPLATIVTGGQRNDGAVLAQVLAEIHVPRRGPGAARTRPEAVIADRAYATGVIRTELRRRRIRAVIPDKKDQIAARQRRGSRGGRPRPSTGRPTAGATSWNGTSPWPSNGAAWLLATTSSPSPTAPPSVKSLEVV
ncbi:transposase [Micrococcus luteus]|uniref:transposase n=1 Tax=Micrococcus luteus TaxID=1270 RepID=UPI003F64DD96